MIVGVQISPRNHALLVLLELHTVYICLSPTGFALAIVTHVLCSRFLMFAAKLLTHMMVACLGTQVRPNLTSNVVNQLNIEGKQSAYSN